MAVPRASSGLLRSQIRRRPASLNTSIAKSQIRTQIRGKDDLGGPGGQAPPPQKPGGPEAMKRNWPAIGGVALVLIGAYAYLSGDGPKTKDKGREAMEEAKKRADELKKQGKEGAEKLKAKGEEGLKKLEGKDTGVDQLSGRKGNTGPFRSE